EASPRGGHAVADPPLAQVNPAVGPFPELFEEYVLVDCLLALLVLAPSGVVSKKAVPRPLFLLLRLLRLKRTEGVGISEHCFCSVLVLWQISLPFLSFAESHRTAVCAYNEAACRIQVTRSATMRVVVDQ
ncbi:unnamed protein product, partial [Ectocarpus sp. 12 AP-2014]